MRSFGSATLTGTHVLVEGLQLCKGIIVEFPKSDKVNGDAGFAGFLGERNERVRILGYRRADEYDDTLAKSA